VLTPEADQPRETSLFGVPIASNMDCEGGEEFPPF